MMFCMVRIVLDVRSSFTSYNITVKLQSLGTLSSSTGKTEDVLYYSSIVKAESLHSALPVH